MSGDRVLLAAAWMGGAIVSFSATAIAIRSLAPAFGPFEILAMRNAAGLAILLLIALVRQDGVALLRPRGAGLHLVRNLVHFTGTYAWTQGVILLPIATVFALEFTSPLWVAALAIAFIGERLSRARLIALASGFVGVLVILRPGFGSVSPTVILVLYAALAFAFTAIITKRMTRTMSTFTILMWMNAIQLPMNLVMNAALPQDGPAAEPFFWLQIESGHALPLAGIALGGLFSHWCLTSAYRYGDASLVATLDFLRVPLAALLGWELYGEAIDPFVLSGSALIITGIVWNLRAEARGRTGGAA